MVNKKEIVNSISAETGFDKKDVDVVVKSFLNVIGNSLASHEEVRLPGIGTFKIKERAARVGHNPRTKEQVEIPAKTVVAFSPAKDLKEKVDS